MEGTNKMEGMDINNQRIDIIQGTEINQEADVNQEMDVKEGTNILQDMKQQSLKQIDEHVPIRLESKHETQMLRKELSDTRAYLDIVLRDLAEAKQAKLGPITEKKKDLWKIVALFETVLVLSGVIIFGIYSMNQQSIPTMNAEEPTVEESVIDTADHQIIETTFLNDQLTQLVAEDTITVGSEFVPSVTTLFGYEYLVFSNGEVSVYYRNEFPKGEEKYRQTIMIDNGSKIAEFDWNYDFEHGLASLIPYSGDFFATGEEQLIFPVYVENHSSVIPKQLRSVTVHNLLEQESIDIEKQLEEIFTATYEEVGNDVTNPDTRMKLAIGAATYTYAIKNEDYINAVYSEEQIISYEKYFTLTFDDDKIAITLIPYISEQEYLGELSGRITVNNNQLVLSNVSYAAYALANQEDAENGGLIIPRTEILGTDRISLWGFHNETYLLELSKNLEPNPITQEKLTIEENGLVSYTDGDLKSIPGIDVSKFQGEIDWKQVKEAGIEYAIIRVGFRGFNEGTLELDPYFEQNIKEATKAGIPVGVYFFSQAISKEEALEEAEFVLDKIKGYKLTYPIIIDTEHVITYDARANNLSRQERTDIAKTFCEKVKQSGYQPMIYANTKWMIMGIDLEQLTEYDLWYAYYGDDLSFPYQFDMLQYSSEGSIPGIEGHVDLNFSLKDYSIK